MSTSPWTRRQFSQQMLTAAGIAALGGRRSLATGAAPRGKAQSCILLWMGGGMAHIDTFDPKRLGDPAAGTPGSAYTAIETAVPGVSVCEHLSRTAKLLDRGTILRTVNHPLFVDHADSTNLVKTGRVTTGAIVFPSLGSLITHQLGPRDDAISPYVVMGMPNVTRGPGFLGAKYGYIYLTDPEAGPGGLRLPADVTPQRDGRRRALLEVLRETALDDRTRDYDTAITKSQDLAHGRFAKVFDLQSEPDGARQRYGGAFGQRCLLARRLVESGTRFVEAAFNLNFVNGTGWDTHRQGQQNQHVIIQELDRALSALIEDLEQRKLLDSTLVIVGTEFGRPAAFDSQGGRGHQSSAFSFALFGGGLKHCGAYGVTDDLGEKPLQNPISVPDLHATILAAFGIDPAQELHADERPIPITDHGKVVADLFG